MPRARLHSASWFVFGLCIAGCDPDGGDAEDTMATTGGEVATTTHPTTGDPDGGSAPPATATSSAEASTDASGSTASTGNDPAGSTDDTGPAPSGTPVDQHGALHVDDGKLVDEHGEAIQLRGVSSMWLNWEDDGYAESREGLRYLRDTWGLSVVRAAMGVDVDGAYFADPDNALGQVRTIVNNAIDTGVYVIIDWHDHTAHQHQGEAVEFFQQMAMEFGDVPNVLYEPYNEPLQISWDAEIKPYHEAVVGALREIDPDNVIILGTPNWSQFVHEAAANPLQGDNLMYTLHFYACTHGEQIRGWGTEAVDAGLALFVTEWAATHADGGLDGLLCEGEADLWHTWMNQHQISWTAWKFDDCEPDSSCMLAPGAAIDGGWTDADLRGHGPYVRARMQE